MFTSYGQLQFTSIPTIEASSGSSVSYKVTTNGGSSATITSSGLDQIGLTLTDNHDGTATIAGILNWPRGTTSASCEITDFDGLCPIDVSATNGAQTITSAIPHKIPVGNQLDSHQEKDLGYLPPGCSLSRSHFRVVVLLQLQRHVYGATCRRDSRWHRRPVQWQWDWQCDSGGNSGVWF